MSADINKTDSGFYNPGFYPYPEENLFSPALLHLKNSETDLVLKYEINFAMIRHELKSIDRNAMLEQAICDYEKVVDACDSYEQEKNITNTMMEQFKKLGYRLMANLDEAPEEFRKYWIMSMTKFVFQK